jgi:hypothetical protein
VRHGSRGGVSVKVWREVDGAFRGTSGIVETSEGELWLNGAVSITRISAGDLRRVVQESADEVDNERLHFRDGREGVAQQHRSRSIAPSTTA